MVGFNRYLPSRNVLVILLTNDTIQYPVEVDFVSKFGENVCFLRNCMQFLIISSSLPKFIEFIYHQHIHIQLKHENLQYKFVLKTFVTLELREMTTNSGEFTLSLKPFVEFESRRLWKKIN